MPVTSADITLAASYLPQVVSIPVDNHWVTAMTLINISQNSEPTQTWASIGIAQNQPSLENSIAIVAQGYLGTTAALFWTGKLIADPDSLLYARIYGTLAHTFRLVAITNKILGIVDGRIIVDP